MEPKSLTDAELLVLGLVSEMPRHGYQLEQVIEQRGMREWTQIGFSSIYFVLGKLDKMGLVSAEKPTGAKAKKIYEATKNGRKELVRQTLAALKNYRATYSSVLLGMVHWQTLERESALAALNARTRAVAKEQKRLEDIRFEQQPLPDFVEALFEFSQVQLTAEAKWIEQTLDYMSTKPWL